MTNMRIRESLYRPAAPPARADPRRANGESFDYQSRSTDRDNPVNFAGPGRSTPAVLQRRGTDDALQRGEEAVDKLGEPLSSRASHKPNSPWALNRAATPRSDTPSGD